MVKIYDDNITLFLNDELIYINRIHNPEFDRIEKWVKKYFSVTYFFYMS